MARKMARVYSIATLYPGIPDDEAGGESLLLVELGVEELPDALLHLLLWQHLWAHQVAPNHYINKGYNDNTDNMELNVLPCAATHRGVRSSSLPCLC